MELYNYEFMIKGSITPKQERLLDKIFVEGKKKIFADALVYRYGDIGKHTKDYLISEMQRVRRLCQNTTTISLYQYTDPEYESKAEGIAYIAYFRGLYVCSFIRNEYVHPMKVLMNPKSSEAAEWRLVISLLHIGFKRRFWTRYPKWNTHAA
jgi:hypothetical protein